jgi:hypothetical protein
LSKCIDDPIRVPLLNDDEEVVMKLLPRFRFVGIFPVEFFGGLPIHVCDSIAFDTIQFVCSGAGTRINEQPANIIQFLSSTKSTMHYYRRGNEVSKPFVICVGWLMVAPLLFEFVAAIARMKSAAVILGLI